MGWDANVILTMLYQYHLVPGGITGAYIDTDLWQYATKRKSKPILFSKHSSRRPRVSDSKVPRAETWLIYFGFVVLLGCFGRIVGWSWLTSLVSWRNALTAHLLVPEFDIRGQEDVDWNNPLRILFWEYSAHRKWVSQTVLIYLNIQAKAAFD